MKKKFDYNSLPEAISELFEKVENIELLIKSLSEKLKNQISSETANSVKRVKVPKVKVAKFTPINQSNDYNLTVEQASAFLGISKTNLYSYVKLSKIPFEKQGRRLIFSKIKLQEWQDARKKTDIKDTKDAITFREAVKLTGLKPSKLQYEIKKRKIPVIGKQGNTLFYSKRELTRALTSD